MRIDSKRTIAMIAGVALTAAWGWLPARLRIRVPTCPKPAILRQIRSRCPWPLAKMILTFPTMPVWAATAAPMKALQRAPNRMAIPILTTQFMAATCHAMYVMLGVMR